MNTRTGVLFEGLLFLLGFRWVLLSLPYESHRHLPLLQGRSVHRALCRVFAEPDPPGRGVHLCRRRLARREPGNPRNSHRPTSGAERPHRHARAEQGPPRRPQHGPGRGHGRVHLPLRLGRLGGDGPAGKDGRESRGDRSRLRLLRLLDAVREERPLYGQPHLHGPGADDQGRIPRRADEVQCLEQTHQTEPLRRRRLPGRPRDGRGYDHHPGRHESDPGGPRSRGPVPLRETEYERLLQHFLGKAPHRHPVQYGPHAERPGRLERE